MFYIWVRKHSLRWIFFLQKCYLLKNQQQNQVPLVRQPRRVATTFLSNLPSPVADTDFNRMCGFSKVNPLDNIMYCNFCCQSSYQKAF